MLAEYREAAERVAKLDQFIPRIHVIHGPRGIGKTSLLREGQRVFEAFQVRTIWVTANSGENLLLAVLKELARLVGAGTRLRKRALSQIESISVELGIAAIGKVSATVRPSADATNGSSSARLIEALRIALDAVESDGGSGVAVLVDEIQEADEASLRTVAYAWQEMAPLAAQHSPPKTAFFAVGLPGAPLHFNKAVSFSERFDFEPLHALEETAVREALAFPAQALGVGWGEDALATAVTESNGYPHKVQLVGESAWREASMRVGGAGLESGHTISVADVRAGLHRVARQMGQIHRSRWSAATPKQRELLIVLAQLGGRDVRRGSMAGALGVDTAAISMARQALLDKGIVDANEYGLLSFTVPGFTEFVLARARDE
jgi:hypothetical protein